MISTPLGGLLPPVLSERQIMRMQQAALDILEHIGLLTRREDVRDALAGQSGVTVRGERVHLAAWLTGELVAGWRKRSLARAQEKHAGAPYSILALTHGMNILDPSTDLIRPLTCADVVAGTRLVEALRIRQVSGGAPGIPMDIPPRLQQIMQFKITLENGRDRSLPAINEPQAGEVIREMCHVVGIPFSTALHMISPLRLEGNEFDLVLHFAMKDREVGVGTMPTAGVTAPVQLPQLFIQSMAEVIGGFAVLRLLGFDKAGFWVNAYPADMHNLGLIMGSPESILCDLMQLAINAYYGVTVTTKPLLTMSHTLDMQTATDSAAHGMALALAGATRFCDGGSLSLDEIWSPEKLLIDCEIIAYLQQVTKGFTFDEEFFCTECFAEGIETGMFVGLDATARHYRDVYWRPRLFRHDKLAQWQAEGEQTLRDHARDAIAEAMQTYDYQLPAEQQRELDRLYHWAEAHLV